MGTATEFKESISGYSTIICIRVTATRNYTHSDELLCLFKIPKLSSYDKWSPIVVGKKIGSVSHRVQVHRAGTPLMMMARGVRAWVV